MQEASALGLQTAVRISQLREQLRKAPSRRNSLPLPGKVRGTVKRSEFPSEHSRTLNRKDSATRNKVPQSRALDKSLKFSESSRLVAQAFGLVGVIGVV